MTLVSTPGGLLFPSNRLTLSGLGGTTLSTILNMNTTAQKVAMIGHMQWDGRAASKTVDSTGSSAIAFRLNSTTWANGASTMDIGIQDVATGAGPLAQPDGTFDVKATVTGGAGLTTGAWNSVAMTTNTKTIANGDLIAVVWDFTNRAGADAVALAALSSGTTRGFPMNNLFTAAAWQTAAIGTGNIPNVVITASDGTLGTLAYTLPASVEAAETFKTGDALDERGLVFQIPWDCKIDGFWAIMGGVDAASDGTLTLYTDPTGTPAAVSGASIAFLAEQLNSMSITVTSMQFCYFALPAEVSLTKNTDYLLALKATGASNLGLDALTLGAAGHRALLAGGTTLNKAVRSAGGAGAFTPTTTIVYPMGVRISSLNDTAGATAAHVIG